MVCDGPILRGPNKGKPARGTSTGVSRHYDAGEKPCQVCRDANNAGMRAHTRHRGNKAGRLVGEWCKTLEHRLTPENTTPNGCRICANTYARGYYRRTVECTACDRWLTPEAYDLHQVSPPGNPDAPVECLSDDELRKCGVFVVLLPGGKDVTEYWRRMSRRKTHCAQGHPYAGDNLYVHPNTGYRECRACRRRRRAKGVVGS